MEGFKYISILLNIHGVVTLILGSSPKLKHDKGSEVGMCPMIQTHSHKCVRMQDNEFQYSQMDFHFESWEVHLMSQNFGIMFVGSNLVGIKPFFKHWKCFKNIYLKWICAFPIWRF
jgi:hypothetical protein